MASPDTSLSNVTHFPEKLSESLPKEKSKLAKLRKMPPLENFEKKSESKKSN
jgi:hypothetical protein